MFRSMVPSLSRKYPAAPEQGEAKQPAVAKATTSIPQPKRKALGDITNNTTIEGPVADGKKPIMGIQHPAARKEIIEEDSTAAFADRAYMQRASDDIDARDSGNPLLAVSYVNEMYEKFNQLETELKVMPSYMNNQSFINERMRAILIDWLVRNMLKV